MSTSVCVEPGCPALATGTRCDTHQRERQRQADANRPARTRTYTTGDPRWRRIRARTLATEPDCRECGREAEHVDHVNGDPTDNRPANLQPLCGPCHSHKTSTQDQRRDEQGRWTANEGERKPTRKRRSGSTGSMPLG